MWVQYNTYFTLNSKWTSWKKNVRCWYGLMLWNVQKAIYISDSQKETCNNSIYEQKLYCMDKNYAMAAFMNKHAVVEWIIFLPQQASWKKLCHGNIREQKLWHDRIHRQIWQLHSWIRILTLQNLRTKVIPLLNFEEKLTQHNSLTKLTYARAELMKN